MCCPRELIPPPTKFQGIKTFLVDIVVLAIALSSYN